MREWLGELPLGAVEAEPDGAIGEARPLTPDAPRAILDGDGLPDCNSLFELDIAQTSRARKNSVG